MSTCTAHKLIEQSEKGELFFHHDLQKIAKAAQAHVEKNLPNAMCFHMGHQADWRGMKCLPELVKLPYEVCWFECEIEWSDGGAGRIGYLCNFEDEELIVQLFEWDKLIGVWGMVAVQIAEIDTQRNAISMTQIVDQADERTETSRGLCALLFKYLNYVNCCNVKRIKVEPDVALQKARAKRGKKPLFSFWTLDIDPQRSQIEGTGWTGEHASYRSHLRRGHARKLPSGHWCWVRACFVQGQTPGFVHKDYAVIH